MASSSSNPNVIGEVGEECPYPYPSNLSATSFISVKLSARDEYGMWKTQMLCLLESHGMYGFIDGTFVSPQTSFAGKAKLGYGQHQSLWRRSDAVVKGWILGSLSKPTLGFVLNRVTKKLQGRNGDDFSAKDAWDELQTIYGPAVLPQQQSIFVPPKHYDPPPQQTFYGPPPQQTFPDRPPQQTFYGPPPQQTFPDPPPQQTTYGPPPQQTFLVRPPQQTTYGPPPGPPPERTFPDPPPQHTTHGPPPQQTFPDPPPEQTTYGPVAGQHLQPMYGSDFPPQLQHMYGPAVPPQLQTTYGPYHYPQPVVADLDREAEKIRAAAYKHLYDATLRENLYDISDIVSQGQVTVIDNITNDGNTALHVAIGNTKKPPVFIEDLLGLVPKNTQLLNLRNKGGRTLLHVAAIVGNAEAARILLDKDPNLLFAEDMEGHTPLALALSNKNTETSEQFLNHFSSRMQGLRWLESGDELLVTAISSKKFELANRLMELCRKLNSDAVLMAVAQNFPSELSTFEIYLGTNHITRSVLRHYVRRAFSNTVDMCVPLCGPSVEMYLKIIYFHILYSGIRCIILLLLKIPKILVRPFVEERARNYNDCILLLFSVCHRLTGDLYNPVPQLYTNPLFEATRQDSHEVVKEIVSKFIGAIRSTNEDGHTIMQYAVISRSQKVYSLLHEMSEHNTFFKSTKDSCENNILHLAARLAPTNKLNLISGAALQIQRELQWFKEIERFVSPHSILQKNAFDETPHMIFSREHKDLVIEGEKWMKATAESYTITAALITTIVFAAAITVPGGNNDDGIPIFTKHTAFTIFAISDAISLFGAVTSLLMFLSILTARFAEQDFLFKLPTKLLIGLATLFISTAAMIVAFGATLYIVFAQSKPMMLIPIVLLTILPIICFVTLQFPLIKDLMSATYGRSIFGKIINRDFD